MLTDGFLFWSRPFLTYFSCFFHISTMDEHDDPESTTATTTSAAGLAEPSVTAESLGVGEEGEIHDHDTGDDNDNADDNNESGRVRKHDTDTEKEAEEEAEALKSNDGEHSIGTSALDEKGTISGGSSTSAEKDSGILPESKTDEKMKEDEKQRQQMQQQKQQEQHSQEEKQTVPSRLPTVPATPAGDVVAIPASNVILEEDHNAAAPGTGLEKGTRDDQDGDLKVSPQQQQQQQQQQHHQQDQHQVSAQVPPTGKQRRTVPQNQAGQRPGAVSVLGGANDEADEVPTSATTPTSAQVQGSETQPTQQEQLQLQLSQEESYDDEVAQEAAVTVLEATPVQEIIATRVVVEPSSASPSIPPNLRLEHVDIDNFEDGESNQVGVEMHSGDGQNDTDDGKKYHDDAEDDYDDDNDEDDKPQPHQIVLVILAICVMYVALIFVVMAIVVPAPPDHDGSEGSCEKLFFDTVYNLELLRGSALIEFILSSLVVSVQLYQLIEATSYRYCQIVPEDDDEESDSDYKKMREYNPFFPRMIIFVVEILWLTVTIYMLVFTNKKNLLNPSNLIFSDDKCAAKWSRSFTDGTEIDTTNNMDNTTNSNITPQGSDDDNLPALAHVFDDVDGSTASLDGFHVATIVRIPILLWLLISRGRLIFFRTSCEHIKLFWKDFWAVSRGVMELAMFGLCLYMLYANLSEALDTLKELAWAIETSS